MTTYSAPYNKNCNAMAMTLHESEGTFNSSHFLGAVLDNKHGSQN